VRIVDTLCPGEPEVRGLLALMLLHHSRSAARLGSDLEIISLEEQDRSLWDKAAIAEGTQIVSAVLESGQPGPYQLQAAVSALHSEATSLETTNWPEIALLYGYLAQIQPNPVFELNRLVAISYADGPEKALPQLDDLSKKLANYQPFHATRADILRRSGDVDGAILDYQSAINLSENASERRFLQARLDNLGLVQQ
jgi:RNA polymerase sigma-70 factor (ECF subfamily)